MKTKLTPAQEIALNLSLIDTVEARIDKLMKPEALGEALRNRCSNEHLGKIQDLIDLREELTDKISEILVNN